MGMVIQVTIPIVLLLNRINYWKRLSKYIPIFYDLSGYIAG